jgi:hypothetical protein
MTPLTIKDVNQYITMIRINFDNAYKAHTDEEREMLLASWYAILKEYPKEICDKAVIQAIKYAKFAPRIGDIVDQIEKMQVAFEKTEGELWAELTSVLREVSECVYRFRFTLVEANGLTQGDNARIRLKELYRNLSPELQEYCGSERGLIDLSNLDKEQLGYEKGRFNKVMPQLKERARTKAQIGGNLSMLIESMGNKLLLEKTGN